MGHDAIIYCCTNTPVMLRDVVEALLSQAYNGSFSKCDQKALVCFCISIVGVLILRQLGVVDALAGNYEHFLMGMTTPQQRAVVYGDVELECCCKRRMGKRRSQSKNHGISESVDDMDDP